MRRRHTTPEAEATLQEFRWRVEDTGLRGLLSDEAIMFVYLVLGQKMWKSERAQKEADHV